jgi:hypothetical protein
MSPFWMQYEAASAHRPFVHSPEQQSLGALQVLFAVVQPGFPATGSHLPVEPQLPVQHSLPLTGQLAPIVKHWTPPHLPLTQDPLQQSVLPEQAAVSGEHVVIDEAQAPVALSQRCVQQVAPVVHLPPTEVQLTDTLPSGGNTPLLLAPDEASVDPLLDAVPLDPTPLDAVPLDAVPLDPLEPPLDPLLPPELPLELSPPLLLDPLLDPSEDTVPSLLPSSPPDPSPMDPSSEDPASLDPVVWLAPHPTAAKVRAARTSRC